MTVLVDWQIEELCREQNMITPFDPSLLNPASLDVRIGTTLKREYDDGSGFYDVDLSGFSQDRPLMIAPKEAILVSTKETFNMPLTVAGEFRLKSSRAREFWNQFLAVWLDPGWHGSVLTLELVNESRYRHLPIYPGLKIGQIIFHQTAQPKVSYAITGRYNHDRTVAASKG